jgi:redox-sensitive bicupin YhaK (pirin superfamily)
MLVLRKSADRGHADHGWLKSAHTFSFSSYQDPAHMGYRNLRVINEDRVAASKGFGTHSHQDMEIITYVLDGALEHRDSLGNGAVMQPGDVQRMTAGTGVSHSEYNHSKTDEVHLLQIWVTPNQTGLDSSYEQTFFPVSDRQNQFRLIASPEGLDGSVVVHQDMELYATILDAGKTIEKAVSPDRHFWVQVARGSVQVNGTLLVAGDAAALEQIEQITLVGQTASEILIFDLA